MAGRSTLGWRDAKAGTPIVGNKRKWHAADASEWRGVVAGVHEVGLWVDVPLATEHHVAGESAWVQPWHAVELVPFDADARWHWWMFNHDREGAFLYVDICEPVQWTPTGFSYVDLYVDLLISIDGTVRILDEDELEDAVERGLLDAARADRVRRDSVELAELFVANNAAVAREGLERWEALAAR
jgi:predicted RNA-binding protein associated with RNAse of E/G family